MPVPPPRTLVVTPTYNERDNLPRFVEAVRGALPDAAKDSRVGVIRRAGKLGLGMDALRGKL